MSDKVRFGFVSTADIGSKVYQAILVSKNAVPYAVASRSLDKATTWAEKHPGFQKVYGSYDEILDDANVDAVYIPLPTSLKKEWTLKAAAKGKHVLVEKPLPVGEGDVVEMVEACRKAGVMFMDGTMWLHSIRTRQLRAKYGELGPIVRVNSAMTFAAPDEKWLDGGNVRTNKEHEPHGCLEAGWYPIGAILNVTGWKVPSKVQVLYWRVNKMDTLVHCTGAMWFDDGVFGTFETGYLAAHRSFYEVAGSKATLLVEDLVGGQGKSGNFAAYFENFVGSDYYKIDDINGKEQVVQVEPSNHTALMIEDFADCVVSKKPDASWGDISILMQKVVNAVFESYTKGGEVVKLA